MDPLKKYFLLKMGIFQPAMLVYQRVTIQVGITFSNHLLRRNLFLDIFGVFVLLNVTPVALGEDFLRFPSGGCWGLARLGQEKMRGLQGGSPLAARKNAKKSCRNHIARSRSAN